MYAPSRELPLRYCVHWTRRDGQSAGDHQQFGDYERRFGGLSLLSTMSYAVRDFLNGGSQAIIVRVIRNGSTAASSAG